MMHRKSKRKFSRSVSHRRAMMRNMATSLILKERFQTTVEKAKDLRSVVEKLVTKARVDTLHSRRHAYSFLTDKQAVHKLFADIAKRYEGRKGGYTRVLRTSRRPGDAAELALIEFVSGEAKKKTPSRKSRAKKGAEKEATTPAAEA